MALIILYQILIMSLYMAGKITKEGSRSLANMLAWVVVPCNILGGFLTEFSISR